MQEKRTGTVYLDRAGFIMRWRMQIFIHSCEGCSAYLPFYELSLLVTED